MALCEKFIHEFFSQLLVAINDFDLHITVFFAAYLYGTYWYLYFGTIGTSTYKSFIPKDLVHKFCCSNKKLTSLLTIFEL